MSDFVPEHFHVEPVSFMDTHSGGAHLMLTVGVTFSGVVDEDQVRSAVATLARAWPMLGCHVRRAGPENPALELLVPAADHAVLATTVVHLPKPLQSATPLPQRTTTISTQRLTRDLTLFPQPASSAHAYISDTARPGFHLHVSILLDATVFSLTFPHVLMDGSGVGTVMRGLVGAMQSASVQPHIEGDPWASVLADSDNVEHVHVEGWTTYGPSEFARVAEVEQADLEQDGPIVQRTIYFPHADIERLKSVAMHEVGPDVPYLSSGDVVVAWLYKHFYGDEIYSPERTSRFLYILDARLRLASHFPPGQAYLRNAYVVAPASPLPNARVRDMKLGELAAMVRRLVKESGKQESIGRLVKWKWDHAVENGGGVQVPASAGERVMWLTFGLGELNVESLVRPSSGTGRVLDVYCGMQGIPRCSGVITFRDTSGGVTAQFDWGEKNWTSGMMGEYAIEKLGVVSKEAVLETKETEELEERKTTNGWSLYALISWLRGILKL
ncbi:hypothetical protein FRC10_008567 [Ceratobasidium sp. 414]|nr:hypothetical protein FRC10_008567 [Ceratobasidium sp. 414]